MATVVKTEGKHMGEFLAAGVQSISRDTVTLSSGQVVVDGQVLKGSGDEAVAAAGSHNTAGGSTEEILGIVLGNWDASATGTNADIPGVPIIARLAEVKESVVVYHTGGADASKKAAVKEALAAKFIIARDSD